MPTAMSTRAKKTPRHYLQLHFYKNKTSAADAKSTTSYFFFGIRFCSSTLLSSHSSFSFSLPNRNSDPVVSLSRLFSPLPTTVRASIFIARRLQLFSFLVDSPGIAPTHAARRSQQLTPWVLNLIRYDTCTFANMMIMDGQGSAKPNAR